MTGLEKTRGPAAAMIFLLMGISVFTLGATVGISWQKSEVTPMVLVKPGIGGFHTGPLKRRDT